MKITEIRRLKNGRYGLFADEHFLLSLDEETYVRSRICAGDDLNSAQLDKLAAAAQAKKAEEKAYDLLSYRDHSRQELKRKLLRSVDGEAADAALDKMERIGLINDEAYAKKLAHELLDIRRYGAKKALYELTRRGVGREIAQQAVEAMDTDPAQRALQLLRKKFPRGIPDERERRRAVGALGRCGYGWDDIREAMREYGKESENAD